METKRHSDKATGEGKTMKTRMETVRIGYKEQEGAEAALIKAETALQLAACEEFETFQDARWGVRLAKDRFKSGWHALTDKQKKEITPEFSSDTPRYIDAPRKRRDMTHDQLIEACRRRGFQFYDKGDWMWGIQDAGIQVWLNQKGRGAYEVIALVYRIRSNGKFIIDHRESLKRVIEWAKKATQEGTSIRQSVENKA